MDLNRYFWKPWSVALVSIVFALGWISSSWSYHGQFPSDDWRSGLRVDAAGYYIYLPGTFHHGMRASEVAKDLTSRTGEGFIVHYDRDRIITKYTCGVAILQLPFYVIAECIEGWGSTDGFTDTHRRSIEAGAVVYWTLGLLFLGLALQRLLPAKAWVPVVVLPAIAFGSSLFYYAFRVPDFGHVYSFFAVCATLYVFAAYMLPSGGGGGWFAVLSALVVLIRPTDAVIVLGLIVWLWVEQRALCLRPRSWITMALGALLVWTPQLLYWKFTFGHWLADSYDNEAFTNWWSPHVLEFLFAVENGWIPYAPVLLLLPVGMVVLWKQRPYLVLIILMVLAVTIYICAAWHMWNFGCGFGSRPMVQYMPLVAIPVWAFFGMQGETAVRWRAAILPMLCLLVFVNYRLALDYDGCYYGNGPWDWDYFGRSIARAFLGSKS